MTTSDLTVSETVDMLYRGQHILIIDIQGGSRILMEPFVVWFNMS